MTVGSQISGVVENNGRYHAAPGLIELMGSHSVPRVPSSRERLSLRCFHRVN